ncbi:MAG TPA: glycosyltransferase [Chitinophagaceae bacterium]|jgi:UDP:flavonoid glycosyltransferase YjiC (YdhE family)|nr:glycosyltransferase [Chitinophagaceae bacterium]
MDQVITEKTGEKPRDIAGRILLAPLDWGLGHATRCIPIARELINKGCEPWFACDGSQQVLLQAEFPQLNFLPLAGYRVRYAKTAPGLLWQMIRQSPRLLQVIKKEHEWLKQAVDRYGFKAVISDNRYGLHHPSVPSIFITHQLTIKSPLGRWSESLLRKKNYGYINRFNECWVPDAEGNDNLAGELSHPGQLPHTRVRYIGPLSRFEKKNIDERKDHLLFILSGPEPQRSILENKIIHDVTAYGGTATIVRGLPGYESLIPSTNMIRFYNHLPADALNKEIAQADYVISRSGYSTVMDLAVMNKKSILIPTPGQTEQEYLGKYLVEKKLAYCVSQREFVLDDALEKAQQSGYRFSGSVNTTLHDAIASLLTDQAAITHAPKL